MSRFFNRIRNLNPFGSNAPAGNLPQNPKTQQLLKPKTQEQLQEEINYQKTTKTNLNKRHNNAEALRKAQNAASLARNNTVKNPTPTLKTQQEKLGDIFETQEATRKKMANKLAKGKIGGYRRNTRRSTRRSTRRKTHRKRHA